MRITEMKVSEEARAIGQQIQTAISQWVADVREKIAGAEHEAGCDCTCLVKLFDYAHLDDPMLSFYVMHVPGCPRAEVVQYYQAPSPFTMGD